MKYDIDVQFKVGDVVWHKNLVTNEAIKTKVSRFQAMIFDDGGKCVLYHLEDGSPVVNVVGRPCNTNVFATKEECDSYPAYQPE
jgi:hypothetical protein